MTKVVGYVRVSRVGGREGDSFLSPALQREQIESVARREGLTVVEVLEELDASGGDNKRPRWNQAIEMVERGEVGGIAVWNLARFSRSVRDALNALERIEAAGGTLHSATEPVNDRMHRTILLAIGENERDRAAAGFRAATLNAMDRGVFVGGTIPVGYRRDADRRLEVDPDKAPVVQGVFERKAEGWSSVRLATWAREQGHDLTPEGATYMVHNRTYLGELRSGKEVRKDAHPALVTRALWNRCQEKGLQSERTGRLKGKFLLQGIASCAGCGYGLRLTSGGKKGTVFYHCRHRHCTEKAYANALRLDDYVVNALDDLVNAADPATWIPLPGDNRAIEEAETTLAEARSDLDGFLGDTKLRGILGADKYAETVSDYVAVVNKAESDLEEARGRHSGRFELAGRLWLHEWGVPEKHEYLSKMIASCAVTKGREPLSERCQVELR